MGYRKRLRESETVVQIDLDYRTVGKNRDASLGLVGDPGVILGAVLNATTTNRDNGSSRRNFWIEELRSLETQKTEKLMPHFTTDKQPISPYRVAWELNKFLQDDAVYIGVVVTISA